MYEVTYSTLSRDVECSIRFEWGSRENYEVPIQWKSTRIKRGTTAKPMLPEWQRAFE